MRNNQLTIINAGLWKTSTKTYTKCLGLWGIKLLGVLHFRTCNLELKYPNSGNRGFTDLRFYEIVLSIIVKFMCESQIFLCPTNFKNILKQID